MKKALIILAFILSTGAAARADSYFLSAFEFYLHYPENSIIYKTASQGISKDDYLDFLIDNDKPLGDKVALIGALSTYYEFHAGDKSDDFKKYTTRFKQHVYNRITRLDPSEVLLLETLMDDYQTFTPNTNQYNRLADKMPESLTVQSVRVIARAYDILYNRKWNEVSEFENDCLNPYLQSWQNCRQDINPKVCENVEWWLFYIYQSRADDIPELAEEVMQKFAHLFMSVSSDENTVAVEEAENDNDEENIGSGLKNRGTVIYKGVSYENCKARLIDLGESVGVSISQKDMNKNLWNSQFELCFILKKDDYGDLPDSSFTSLSPVFIWNFLDWHTAQHQFVTVQDSITFSPLGYGSYMIFGRTYLDNQEKESIDFFYSGEIQTEPIEVAAIIKVDDCENCKGQLTFADKKINTPFAFQVFRDGQAKIFITDKNLSSDRNLEYGVSFALNHKGDILNGTFSYRKSDADNAFYPAFFNKDKTEYPEEAVLKITSVRPKDVPKYTIEYALKFVDNRIVTGVYKGEIPEREDVVWQQTEEDIEEAQEFEYIEEEQENSSQTAIELPPINEQFTSYFPDMALGEHAVAGSAQLIPQQVVAEFFPDFAEAEKEQSAKIYLYAVGKILNYKGLDLYICDYDYERPDEDSYDNHMDSIRIMLLFKNNIPLKDEYGKRRVRGMNFHYYGEGGESNSNTYFDTDTTLVCYVYSSKSESATGFDTPFIHTKKWRYVLDGDGEEREITEILQMEYSSPFYDCNYLKEKEKEWADVESDGYNHTYPTQDNKWNLLDKNIPVYCIFHIETTDTIENVRFLPVFETYYGYNLIDRYIVGLPRSYILSESSNVPQPTILKCPIIIKTSDGDLEVLPDGKFRIRDNSEWKENEAEAVSEEKEFKVDENQTVICISATLAQIDKIKKTYENEDDFFTVADDASYYFYTANQYLEQKNLTCVNITSDCSIYLVAEKKRVTVPKEMENVLFFYFIYEKGKYQQFVYSFDIGESWIYENGHWQNNHY